MPQILARRDSLGRSGASLAASRSSLRRCSSRRSSLGSAAGHPSYGSQFSLRRLLDAEKTASQPALYRPQANRNYDPTSRHGAQRNEEWTFEVPKTAAPPSLTSSETSASSSSSSAQSSTSQSSLQQALSRPPSRNAVKALERYYALRRASLQSGAPLPSSLGGSPRRASQPRRSSLTNLGPASRSVNSFLSQGIKEEDIWGQFVDTQDAEEDLVRRSKILSLTQRYHAVGSPSQGRLR